MFIFRILPKDKPYTPREILSVISSIYDPLGFVSPAVVPARKLMQDLCKQGLGWDEKIGNYALEKWISVLPKCSHIAVPRCLKPTNLGTAEVTQRHHFANASQIAYGAVSIARFVNEEKKCPFPRWKIPIGSHQTGDHSKTRVTSRGTRKFQVPLGSKTDA